MNGAQLGYIAVVVTIIAGLAGVWYAAKQANIAQRAQQMADTDRAVAEAVGPLRDKIAEQDRVIARRDATIEQLNARIYQLTDRLGGAGHAGT